MTRADRYTPGIDRVFLEYAQFRGFVVDPTLVRHATGKPKVERGIPYNTAFLEVQRVEKIVRAALERAPGPPEGTEVRPLPARFARAPPELYPFASRGGRRWRSRLISSAA